jgi:hypothetical protein
VLRPPQDLITASCKIHCAPKIARPGGFSARLSYTHRDANLQTVCPCNNIPDDVYSVATDYMDAQVTFAFPWYEHLKFAVQAQDLLQQVQMNRYENRGSMLMAQPTRAAHS